jgi:hypothetical protein
MKSQEESKLKLCPFCGFQVEQICNLEELYYKNEKDTCEYWVKYLHATN